MAREHKIIAGEKYGKYTAIENVIHTTSTGIKVWKWMCKNELGEIVYKKKGDLLDFLSSKELETKHITDLENMIRNNTYQMGIRNRYFDEYSRNTRLKKHGFHLSFDQFNKLISSDCFYCGQAPQESKSSRWRRSEHKKQPSLKYNGIDRVDSSIGYTIENTVPACSMCNIMKNIYSQEDFLNHISKIYLFNNKTSTTRA